MRTKRLRIPAKPTEPVKPNAKLKKYISQETRVDIHDCISICEAISQVKKKLISLGFDSKNIDDKLILFSCDNEYNEYDVLSYSNLHLFYSSHGVIECENPSYNKQMAAYTKALETFKQKQAKYLEDLAAYTKQEEEMILKKAEHIKKKRQNAR